jgi:tyrosinase
MVDKPGVLIRREVRSLTDDTLQWYAIAVAEMMQRDKETEPKNPTSWWYQAAIHGTHLQHLEALWNQCKHGGWYFVAWHRMYTYYFERIVRDAVVKAGGPEDWALPYWNYGLNGKYASIPDAFRSPTDSHGNPNPLYVKARRPKEVSEKGVKPGINEGGILSPAITTDAFAISRPGFIGGREFGGGISPPREQFWSQTGRLEQTPHNDVHNGIGGEDGLMTDPDEAAKDPIFWLHHSNIDRIWAEWSLTHSNPVDGAWKGWKFKFFDESGKEASKACGEVVDTVANLGYTYDVIRKAEPKPSTPQPPDAGEPPTQEGPEAVAVGEPAAVGSESANSKVVGASEEAVTLTGGTETVPVPIDARSQDEVLEASRAEDPRHLYLNIEDIEGEKNPGTVYGVYVNLPENPDESTLAEHHVGNLSFFGIERARNPRGDEHGHNLRLSMEVGELLRQTGGGEQFGGEEVHVTFLPLSLISPGGETEEAFDPPERTEDKPPVQVGRVSVTVD